MKERLIFSYEIKLFILFIKEFGASFRLLDMIPKILDFRLRQIGRMLKEVGAGYFILLLLVCFGFFMGLVNSLVKSQTPWMGLIGVLIAASIHFSRKDGSFLKKLEINRPKLYALEYLVP